MTACVYGGSISLEGFVYCPGRAGDFAVAEENAGPAWWGVIRNEVAGGHMRLYPRHRSHRQTQAANKSKNPQCTLQLGEDVTRCAVPRLVESLLLKSQGCLGTCHVIGQPGLTGPHDTAPPAAGAANVHGRTHLPVPPVEPATKIFLPASAPASSTGSGAGVAGLATAKVRTTRRRPGFCKGLI